MKPVRRLTLVSSSPRRKEMLAGLVDELRIVEPDCHEIPVRKAADALTNALRKLMSAFPRPSELAIAADTAVFLDGEALGKPSSPEDARRILRALSGRWHEVSTGLAVGVDGIVETAVVTTRVLFRKLDDVEIDAYVATGEPLDKAGASAACWSSAWKGTGTTSSACRLGSCGRYWPSAAWRSRYNVFQHVQAEERYISYLSFGWDACLRPRRCGS